MTHNLTGFGLTGFGLTHLLAGVCGSLVALALLSASPALAHPGGGGGGGGLGAGGASGLHGDFGGQSGGHIGAQGLAHSNGPNSLDRDFGRDRAADRMNTHGLLHSRAHHHLRHFGHRR